MKKIILLFALVSYLGLFSQCKIIGADQVKVGEKQTYKVENQIAKCDDCYRWTTIGETITFDGSVKKNEVSLIGVEPGKTNLSLIVSTDGGEVKCAKSIIIIDPYFEVAPAKQPENCDVDFSDFTEVRNSDEVMTFVPINKEGTYKYEWTATYGDGDVKVSNDKNPSFPYSKANGILDIKVKVTSTRCVRTISKKYEPSFWMFF